MNREEMMDALQETEAIVATGLDDCIVGIARGCAVPDKAVYSEQAIIELLMKRDDMSWEEASEFYEYNIVGAYIENGPIYVQEVDDRQYLVNEDLEALQRILAYNYEDEMEDFFENAELSEEQVEKLRRMFDVPEQLDAAEEMVVSMGIKHIFTDICKLSLVLDIGSD